MPSSTEFTGEFYGGSLVLAGASIGLYTVYQIGLTIYNVWFRPLAKFPGPKTAAASQIPYVRALLAGKQPQWVKKLHDQYQSDVVRISPCELSFIGVSAWPDIHGHHVGMPLFERDPLVNGKSFNGVEHLFSARNADHGRMRGVLGHAFSEKAIRAQEPAVQTYIDKLICRLHQEVRGSAQGKVSLVKRFTWMAFDIMGDLTFGESFHSLDDQKHHPWVENVFGNAEAVAFMSACNRFSISRILLPYLIPKRVMQMVEDTWTATEETLARRIELGTDRPDFMSPVLENNRTDGKGLSKPEILANAWLIVNAGSETTAGILGGTTFYLLSTGLIRKATTEVREKFGKESDINAQSFAQLPYLLACLWETHRMYPAGVVGQAVVVPSQGAAICGYWIPGNTGVTNNQYASYRSKTIFKNPDDYIPERWLGDSNYASDQRTVFQPFAYCARNCIGKGLANMETCLVVARMIWNFDMELCKETGPDWDDQKAYMTWQKKPLIIKLTPSPRAKAVDNQSVELVVESALGGPL